MTLLPNLKSVSNYSLSPFLQSNSLLLRVSIWKGRKGLCVHPAHGRPQQGPALSGRGGVRSPASQAWPSWGSSSSRNRPLGPVLFQHQHPARGLPRPSCSVGVQACRLSTAIPSPSVPSPSTLTEWGWGVAWAPGYLLAPAGHAAGEPGLKGSLCSSSAGGGRWFRWVR